MFRLKNNIKTLGGKFFKEVFPLYPGLKNLNIILTYHRVLKETPTGIYDPCLFVTQGTFEMHIKEISKLFRIVSLDNLIENQTDSARLCAITFDDGWIDNYEIAFPVLKKYQAPATIFISTDLVSSDRNLWFQDLWSLGDRVVPGGRERAFIDYFNHLIPGWNPQSLSIGQLSNLAGALKSLSGRKLDGVISDAFMKLGVRPTAHKMVINWEHASEMSKFEVSFGSHGLHHWIVSDIDRNSKRKEIFESINDLRTKPVKVTPIFSFPNGNWDEESIALISEAGYRGALIGQLGYNTAKSHPLLLKRVSFHEYISNSPSLFWFRIFQALKSGCGQPVVYPPTQRTTGCAHG